MMASSDRLARKSFTVLEDFVRQAQADELPSLKLIHENFYANAEALIKSIPDETIAIYARKGSSLDYPEHNAKGLANKVYKLHECYEIMKLKESGLDIRGDLGLAQLSLFRRAHSEAVFAESILLAILATVKSQYRQLGVDAFRAFRAADVIYDEGSFVTSARSECVSAITNFLRKRAPRLEEFFDLAGFTRQNKQIAFPRRYVARLRSWYLLSSIYDRVEKPFQEQMEQHGQKYFDFTDHFYCIMLGLFRFLEEKSEEIDEVDACPVERFEVVIEEILQSIIRSIRWSRGTLHAPIQRSLTSGVYSVHLQSLSLRFTSKSCGLRIDGEETIENRLVASK